MGDGQTRRLDQVRDRIRRKHYSIRTEKPASRSASWSFLTLPSRDRNADLECVRLRVKDVDFARGEIVVRQGKGGKDRMSVLPWPSAPPLPAPRSSSRIPVTRAGDGPKEVEGSAPDAPQDARGAWG